MKDNIIQFPGAKTEEKNQEDPLMEKIAYDTLYKLFDDVLGRNANFDKEKLLPMSILVIETVKAFYLKSNDEFHPLQEFADDFFENLDF